MLANWIWFPLMVVSVWAILRHARKEKREQDIFPHTIMLKTWGKK